MGFDANGTYTRWEGPDTWQKDATAGTKILANRHDSHDGDIGSALSDCLNRRGKGAALANLSMGGFKLTNLLTPSALTDAANKDYVDNRVTWTKSLNIDGADANGRLNFTAPSGVNGITWTYVDIAWVARKAKTGETPNRLVMNNTKSPSSTSNAGDVFMIDDSGRINNGTTTGVISHNALYDGSTWRAISPGYGTVLGYSGGAFTLASNNTATITNAYAPFTAFTFFIAQNQNGTSSLQLNKSASGKNSVITGSMANKTRWAIWLGDGTAESSTRSGSDFQITSYDNNGGSPVQALLISRGGAFAYLNGDTTINGSVTSTGYFISSTNNVVLQSAAPGNVILRPYGYSVNEQAVLNANGYLTLCNGNTAPAGGIMAGMGLRGKLGSLGAYAGNHHNFYWTGSGLDAYIDATVAHIQLTACDYRIKKDIAPLPSVWDRVKALKPISYTQAAYDIWTNDDTPRWGFLAHEVGDDLSPAAVIGEKDGPDVQGINLISIIAGLTKGLQEAMERIETLEAAP